MGHDAIAFPLNLDAVTPPGIPTRIRPAQSLTIPPAATTNRLSPTPRQQATQVISTALTPTTVDTVNITVHILPLANQVLKTQQNHIKNKKIQQKHKKDHVNEKLHLLKLYISNNKFNSLLFQLNLPT